MNKEFYLIKKILKEENIVCTHLENKKLYVYKIGKYIYSISDYEFNNNDNKHLIKILLHNYIEYKVNELWEE